jgi:mannose-6-phosphate isomerase-like protein (cupin superfamily)
VSLKAGDTLDLSALGFTLSIRKTAAETGGESFETEMVLAPNRGGTPIHVPIHVHPKAIETFEALSGTFEVYIDGAWRPVKTGERVGVPRGVLHSFRNPGSEPARVYNTHKPALRYDEYFEGLWRVTESGMVKAGVKNWQAVLALSALTSAYPEEIRSVSPPNLVVRALGAFGAWLGYGP